MNEQLMAALATVQDPELHKDLVTLGMIKKAEIDGPVARIGVELTTPACPLKDKIGGDVTEAVQKVLPDTKVEIEWTAQVRSGRAPGPEPMPSLDAVKNIVLVASGKGGVGKSTVAVNLACALVRTGSKVGLLDADIYGPSIPTMLDLHEEVTSSDGKTIDPHELHGIKVMSMGFFLPPSKAMIWRGPMLHSAIMQFLKDVSWGELDYLVVDLPPGTGDVQLTFAQKLKVSGAVIVSTPQNVALADVVRAKAMFDSVKIPVLGLVENMSYFICDSCDKRHSIFAHGGARKAAEQMDIPFLQELPIEFSIREGGDRGMPVVLAEPDSSAGRSFVDLARTVAGRISVLSTQLPPMPPPPPAADAGGRRTLPIVG